MEAEMEVEMGAEIEAEIEAEMAVPLSLKVISSRRSLALAAPSGVVRRRRAAATPRRSLRTAAAPVPSSQWPALFGCVLSAKKAPSRTLARR